MYGCFSPHHTVKVMIAVKVITTVSQASRLEVLSSTPCLLSPFLQLYTFILLFSYVYACVSVWGYVHMCAGACVDQMRVSHPPELLAVLSCLMWVLGTKLRTSARTGKALNC